MKNEFDLPRDINTIKQLPFRKLSSLYNKVVEKYPHWRWILVGIVFLVVIICLVTWWLLEDNIKIKVQKTLGIYTEGVPMQPSNESQKDNNEVLQETKLESDYINNNQCNGYQFDIVGKYLTPVGKERFFAEDFGYSARNTEYFQASSQTKWGCSMPFIAQTVVVPLSGKSFGLFFEYKDMFKVLIGDGDRKTIKVEQNKLDSRKREWKPVKDINGNERQKLGNPIEDGEEVILVVKVKQRDNLVYLRVEIYHSKLQSREIFNYSFTPNAVNIQTIQDRAFRIGINDSHYKGEESVVDLKTLSVTEGEW